MFEYYSPVLSTEEENTCLRLPPHPRNDMLQDDPIYSLPVYIQRSRCSNLATGRKFAQKFGQSDIVRRRCTFVVYEKLRIRPLSDIEIEKELVSFCEVPQEYNRTMDGNWTCAS
jgi:hypothetical protein